MNREDHSVGKSIESAIDILDSSDSDDDDDDIDSTHKDSNDVRKEYRTVNTQLGKIHTKKSILKKQQIFVTPTSNVPAYKVALKKKEDKNQRQSQLSKTTTATTGTTRHEKHQKKNMNQTNSNNANNNNELLATMLYSNDRMRNALVSLYYIHS